MTGRLWTDDEIHHGRREDPLPRQESLEEFLTTPDSPRATVVDHPIHGGTGLAVMQGEEIIDLYYQDQRIAAENHAARLNQKRMP